jgi:ankyrin repeat protein
MPLILKGLAVESNNQIAELLLRRGAKVDEPISLGSSISCLHWVCVQGAVEFDNKFVELLVKHDADVNKTGKLIDDDLTLTPLLCAVLKRRFEAVKTRVENGANVNYTTIIDNISLKLAHFTKTKSTKEIWEYLKNSGALV